LKELRRATETKDRESAVVAEVVDVECHEPREWRASTPASGVDLVGGALAKALMRSLGVDP